MGMTTPPDFYTISIVVHRDRYYKDELSPIGTRSEFHIRGTDLNELGIEIDNKIHAIFRGDKL